LVPQPNDLSGAKTLSYGQDLSTMPLIHRDLKIIHFDVTSLRAPVAAAVCRRILIWRRCSRWLICRRQNRTDKSALRFVGDMSPTFVRGRHVTGKRFRRANTSGR